HIDMKTKILLIAFLFFIVGQSFAQPRHKEAWKHEKKHHKKVMKWEREQDKKRAEYHREMRKDEREYYRELAHKEREYYKNIRKHELKHLKHCHGCNHGFYHNDNHYYRDEIYYSRRTHRPIAIDTEIVFRNGSIRLQL